MQNLCGTPCYFGTKPNNDPNTCVCIHGYWGPSCDQVCPGGASNPCSGFDTCDQSSGTCSCPVNREDSDCSGCSPGWLGERCEVSETAATSSSPAVPPRAWLQGLGHILNADGLGFYVSTPGIYSLLTVSDRVLLQGKFVRCFENFTCTTFVSVLVGQAGTGYARITVQAAWVRDGKPEVYVGNSSVSVDSDVFFTGVTLSRPSLTEVGVSVLPDLNIVISSSGLYLTVAVEIPAGYLTSTSGLLSGSGLTNSSQKLQHLSSVHNTPLLNYCQGTVSEQQPSSTASSTSVLVGLTPVTLTGLVNASLDLSAFLVDDCEVFVHFPTESHRQQKSSGFSLHMSGSAVYTNFSLPDPADNITVEFMVRQLGASEERQVLFSFTHQDQLVLYLLNDTVFVDASSPTSSVPFSTGIMLNQGAWNKLVFTYIGGSGRLTLYHFNSTAWLERRDLTINTALFSTPGVLAVGSWQPPHDSAPHLRVYPFHGEIENLLIWSSMLEPNVLPDIWLMDPVVARSRLSSAWTFDEGHGLSAVDIVDDQSLSLPAPPLTSPQWLASDVDYILTRDSDSSLDLVLASALSTGGEVCETFITQLNFTGCGVVSEATKQDLTSLCGFMLDIVDYEEAALSTVLSYAALCSDSLSVPQSHLQQVCDAREAWRDSPVCSPDCVFGISQLTGPSSCSCTAGYYGNQCQAVCPGGSDSPCSLHGECLSNGTCRCLPNWGSSDCSACSSNYVATDCSIFTSSPLTSGSRTVAVLSTTADVITFTGLHVPLAGVRGVYTLFKDSVSSSGTEVQAMVVWCSYGSCVAGVAITADSHNITVLPSPQSVLPSVYINGSKLLLPTNSTLTSSLTLTMTSVNSLTFTVGTIVDIEIMIKGGYVDVVVKSESSACSSSVGLLDVCQTVASSLYGAVASQSLSDLHSTVETNFKVSDSDILFQTSDQQAAFSSSTSSYSLSFNGTSAWSGPVTVASSAGLQDFTISIHVKPHSHGGTVLSFGKNTTLSITNENPIKIKCGRTEINTGLALTLDQWNQIIITFLPSQQDLHVFVYNHNSTIQHRLLAYHCDAVIYNGAVMSLGEWVPSPDDQARQVSEAFSGELDELVVWSEPIPVAVVYQVYNMDVDASSFRSILASVLSLNEGLGAVAHDSLLSTNNLYLPPAPWPAPVWTLSDLQLQPGSSSLTSSLSGTEDSAWTSLCDSFFASASVTSTCSIASIDWFRAKCVSFATTAGSSEGAFVAMATFVNWCSVSGTDVATVYASLCAVSSSPPSWLEQQCADCLFGSVATTANSTSTDTCTCLPGFWGSGCGDSCPGGAHNPCSRHGQCSEDGLCWCDRHWTGADCSSCAAGWEGEDCIIGTNLTSATPPTSVKVTGQVTALGRMVTFDGTSFDIVKSGFFNLVHNTITQTFLAIQVIPCPAGLFSSHCVASAVVGSGSNSFEINHNSFSENKITLFGASSELVVRGSLTAGDLKFIYVSYSTLVVSSADLSLNMTITIFSDSLLVTVSARRDVWFSGTAAVSGLMAVCNTQLSIQYSSCLNQSTQVCDGTHVASLPSSCNQRLTLVALLNFFTVHRYIAPSTNSPAGSIITEACLRLDNSGTVVRSVSLPVQHFSLEFHVHMFSFTGVLVSYVIDVNNYIVLGCSGTQLVVFTPQGNMQTGLSIKLSIWTQVLMSWHAALGTLEIYIIDADGLITFKSVRCSMDVFISGGMLTFGQPPAGVSVTVDGVFHGLLDEVRVWSRPTNPSVVSQTWRMSAQDSTPDLHLHWPLNDGSGMAASERRRRSTMYPADVTNPPTWQVSDLPLVAEETEKGDFALDDTSIPTNRNVPTTLFPVAPPTNTSSLAAAESECSSLLTNITSVTECSSLAPALAGLQQQCSLMVYSTGSALNAELLALALAQFCQEKEELTSSPLRSQCSQLQHVGAALPYYGTDCSRSCMFGWTPGLSSCLCYHGYWGTSCSELCPYTALGICNANGPCSDATGLCSCSPHWLHTTVTTRNYWTSSVTVVDTSYACTVCTEEWTGSDCSVTVTTVKAGVTWQAAVIFSNYLTTWDGASLGLILPGTYQVIDVEGAQLTALFLPCPRLRLCRFISHLAVTVETFHLQMSVGSDDVSKFTVLVRVGGEDQNATFPVTKTWGRVTLTWWVERYVRITVDDKLILVFSSSPAGLTIGTKVHRDWFAKVSGLLGTPDGSHINDLLPSSSGPTDLAAVKISQHQRSSFLLTGADLAASLGTFSAGQNLTSCGHMLRMTHHTVTFSSLNVAITTQQLTLTFWLRLDTILMTSTPVLELKTSVGVITVSVHQYSIVLTWLGSTATLHPNDIHIWTYLAMTWEDSAGQLTVFAIQSSGFDYATLTTSSLPVQQIVITEVKIAGPRTNNAAVEVDLIRLWQAAQSLEAIARDLNVYTADPDLDPKSSKPVLLMSAAFDEGEGQRTTMSLHDGVTPVNASGVIDDDPQAPAASVWTPSTVPVLDVVLPEDVFHVPDTNLSAQVCLKALEEEKLLTHCRDLHAFFSIYLEACIREHQRTGEVNMTVAVANLLAFYCQTTKEVDECELDGYVDFCRPVDHEEEFPVWGIIVICIGVLVVTSCCCCCIAFIVVKKKKKRKNERSLSGSVTHLSWGEEDETTFIRSAERDVVERDIAFVNPAYNRAAPRSDQLPAAGQGQKKKQGKGKGRGKVGFSGGAGLLDRPDSSSSQASSQRPGPSPSFEEKPHMEAWTAAGKHPIQGHRTRGGDRWAAGLGKDPQAPLGFYTSQDPGDVFIYSPEQTGGARPPQATGLSPTSSSAPLSTFRLQSVPDQDRVILDRMEIEEPQPILFHHDGDDDNGYRPSSSRQSSHPSRPSTTQTVDRINLAFEN